MHVSEHRYHMLLEVDMHMVAKQAANGRGIAHLCLACRCLLFTPCRFPQKSKCSCCKAKASACFQEGLSPDRFLRTRLCLSRHHRECSGHIGKTYVTTSAMFEGLAGPPQASDTQRIDRSHSSHLPTRAHKRVVRLLTCLSVFIRGTTLCFV